MNSMFTGLRTAAQVALGAAAVLVVAHQAARGKGRKDVDARLAEVEKLLTRLKEREPDESSGEPLAVAERASSVRS